MYVYIYGIYQFNSNLGLVGHNITSDLVTVYCVDPRLCVWKESC